MDVLRAHLVEELHIPADQVKVATGTERGLDGLDLASRACPVRYIITMQALREGWDCPFAYILCSVQSIRSATAVEQLLGRVLRMPYATRRTQPALNKAYAHVTEAETGMAANALADRLIDGMGFDPLDMASMIAPQLPLELPLGFRDDGPLFAKSSPELPALAVDLPADKALPAAVQEAVTQGVATVSTDGVRQRVQWRGAVPAAVGEALVAAQKGKQREQVAQQIERHNALVAGAQAPANRGAVFVPVPRLCYRPAQGELVLLEREAVLADLEDGSEEWRCAMALDDQARVQHWVRNLDSDPVAGFWLPTSYGRFYPDFVCQLTDGRVFVAEYKGEHLRTVPKEIEKAQVGAVWAERSNGRAVFAMIYKLERGMTMMVFGDAKKVVEAMVKVVE